jgi:hypothetical protein
MTQRFNVTNHALARFREKTGQSNICKVLEGARPCNDTETMDIITAYIHHTQGPKHILDRRERFFISGNIVFTCIQEDIDKYVVVTCWTAEIAPSFVSRTAWQNLKSPQGTIPAFLNSLNDGATPDKMRYKIRKIYKNNINVSKEDFMKAIISLKP